MHIVTVITDCIFPNNKKNKKNFLSRIIWRDGFLKRYLPDLTSEISFVCRKVFLILNLITNICTYIKLDEINNSEHL